MNKAFTLAAALILVMSLTSCKAEAEVRYLESTVTEEYIGTLTIHREFEYDAEGRMISSVLTNGDTETRTAYTYTENTIQIQLSQDGQTAAMKQVVERDENGNIIHADLYQDGTLTTTTVMTYDEKGQLLTNTQTTHATGMAHTTTYTYDADGNELRIIHEYDSFGTVTENTYDPNGLILESTEHNLDGNLISRAEYSRPGEGQETVCHYDAQGALTSTERVTYDENGNIMLCEVFDAAGELQRRSTYTYIALEIPAE